MKVSQRETVPGSKSMRLSLWLAAYAVMAVFVYGMLVIGDFILARIQERSQGLSAGAAIEAQRVMDEDIPQRAAAIAEGFHPILYPTLIETEPALMALAQRFGVAPLASHPNTPLYYCNEGYGLLTFHTDRFGFRNPDAIWNERDTLDLVLIGDSFVHGACVPTKASIAGRLSQDMTVLNLGIGGNSPVHYVATAKTFLPHVTTKAVALVFYANDNGPPDQGSYYRRAFFEHDIPYLIVTRDGLHLDEALTQFYSAATPVMEGARGAQSPVMSLTHCRICARGAKYLSLPTIRKTLGEMIGRSKRRDELPADSRLAIDTVAAHCPAPDCTTVVAYIPESPFWRPDPRAAAYASALAAYAAKIGVTFVDTTPKIRALGQDAYASKGPHLSPEGYAFVAAALRDAVRP